MPVSIKGTGYIMVPFAVLLIFGNGEVKSQEEDSNPCAGSGLHSPECLEAVKDLLEDEDRFWFGSNYSQDCGHNVSPGDQRCMNPTPQFKSIIARAFQQQENNSMDTIRHVLNVTFNVPAGTYEVCGQRYSAEAVLETVDPLARSAMPGWSASHMPEVTWEAGPTDADKLRTLFVWDAGALRLHGLFFNINGTSLKNYEIAWSYRGPENTIDRDQPNVFLLYDQETRNSDAFIREHILKLIRRDGISPSNFRSNLHITGPVAVSVLIMRTDPFATVNARKERIVNMCPKMLTPKFTSFQLSYDLSKVILTSSVDVTFVSPEITVSSCCQHQTYVRTSRSLNPLGNGAIKPVYARFAPQITLVPPDWSDLYYFTRIKLSLLLLDITDHTTASETGIPFPLLTLHWQVTDILQADIRAARTALPYRAPIPLTGGGRGPGGGQRLLMFLLLRNTQNTPPHLPSGKDLCQDPEDDPRCRFNLTRFMDERKLRVEGASWFVTSPDIYSRSEVVRQGVQSAVAACSRVAQYSTCGAQAVWPGTGALSAVMLLVSAVGQLTVGHLFLPSG